MNSVFTRSRDVRTVRRICLHSSLTSRPTTQKYRCACLLGRTPANLRTNGALGNSLPATKRDTKAILRRACQQGWVNGKIQRAFSFISFFFVENFLFRWHACVCLLTPAFGRGSNRCADVPRAHVHHRHRAAKNKEVLRGPDKSGERYCCR